MFIEICSASYLISVGWKLLIASKCQEGYHPSDAKLSCFAGSLTPPTWSCLEDILYGGGQTNDRACRHSIAMTTLHVQDGSSMFISFVRIHVQRWRTWRMPRSSLVGKGIPSFPALCALPCAIQATLLHPSRWNAIWESSRQQNFRANLTLASFTWFRTV